MLASRPLLVASPPPLIPNPASTALPVYQPAAVQQVAATMMITMMTTMTVITVITVITIMTVTMTVTIGFEDHFTWRGVMTSVSSVHHSLSHVSKVKGLLDCSEVAVQVI